MEKQSYDISNRQKEFDEVMKQINRLELGIRAVSIMYDEHSSDKNSKDNIFRLKENIHYRLLSAGHIYKLFLQELFEAERVYEEMESKKIKNVQLLSTNPFIEILERNISAVFDSVVFNLVSAFDYLSHQICYISNTQKNNTLYWTKLAKAARNVSTDIGGTAVSKQIDQIDRVFVGNLYDYRSSLIHNKRESRPCSFKQVVGSGKFTVQISIPSSEMKHFKLIYDDHNNEMSFSLSYMTSWLIKTSCKLIEQLLDELVIDIKSQSAYHNNIQGANGKGNLVALHINPQTNQGEPVSEYLWRTFKTVNK